MSPRVLESVQSEDSAALASTSPAPTSSLVSHSEISVRWVLVCQVRPLAAAFGVANAEPGSGTGPAEVAGIAGVPEGGLAAAAGAAVLAACPGGAVPVGTATLGMPNRKPKNPPVI